MKRIEKAYQIFSDGIVLHKSNGIKDNMTIEDCCPYYLDCGTDDLNEETMVGKIGDVKGCRNIPCEQCWNKEVD